MSNLDKHAIEHRDADDADVGFSLLNTNTPTPSPVLVMLVLVFVIMTIMLFVGWGVL
jgi:hypothetical protein